MNTILNVIYRLARVGEVKPSKLMTMKASFRSELTRMLAFMTALIAAAVIAEV